MTLPNIQSQHPDIHDSFSEASNLERQAAELLEKANQTRINVVEQLRMRQGWSKSHLAKVIGFQPQFIFRILQGKYPMKECYLEKVDAGLNTQLSDAQRSE
jgi:ribosome-binding protein aMBF1 (putative translation factor)